jgi:hypothetical protein
LVIGWLILTSCEPIVAERAAIRKSQTRVSSKPPPTATPLIAAILGLGKFRIKLHNWVKGRQESPETLQARVVHHVDVGAGAEATPCTGYHDRSHVAIVARGLIRSA